MDGIRGTSVTDRILAKFYDNVERLPEYLERMLPGHAKEQVRRAFEDPCSASGPLATALIRLGQSKVGTRQGLEVAGAWCRQWQIPTAADIFSGGSLSELVQQAQTKLLRVRPGLRTPSNMLTLGYREADDRIGGLREVRMAGSMAMTNFYVNTHVTNIVVAIEWQHLLNHLGPGVVLHLLTDVSLFMPICESDGNMMQILGNTLAEVPEVDGKGLHSEKQMSNQRKRKRSRHRAKGNQSVPSSMPEKPVASAETMEKRSKSDSVLAFGVYPSKAAKDRSRRPTLRKASEIDIVRNRIFYARPIRNRSGQIAAGLPIVHIFNRSTPREVIAMREKRKAKMWGPERDSPRVDKRTRETRARRVLQYIWPREHGLHNVLTGETDRWKTREKWPEYTNREEAIRNRGPNRTPKRLQTASRLACIMLSKHDRLDYAKLLRYCCPSSLPVGRLTATEKEEILVHLSQPDPSLVAGEDRQPSTQATQRQGFDLPFTQPTPSEGAQRPAFTKYRVPAGSVSRFAQAVVRNVVPIDLFGSNYNLRVLLKKVDAFVGLRRHETLNLHQLCQGFRLLDCHWLLPRSKRAQEQRPTSSEMGKRQTMLNELLYYLFDSLLIPLLRTNFYVTDSAAFRNRTVYFRQDDWNSITQPLLEKLKEDCFTTVSKNEAVGIMSGRDFGYSHVRLLPKHNGVRPIVNLRRRSVKIDRNRVSNPVVQQQQSINNILNVTFHVLNYEKKSQASVLGSSVFGAQDIYKRVQAYKAGLVKQWPNKLPRLYFVKVDVACAFDSIDQEKLLEIVGEIVCHDRYVIQRFSQIMSKSGRASKSWSRIASSEEDHEPFASMITEHAKEYSNAIFSDGVVYSHCDRDRLMWLLEEHINNNLIKVGKEFCKQRVGIPQGSSLSTLLCCYYLARMEKEKNLLDQGDKQSLLMRYTDDFLFISTSQEKARRFYETMKQGDSAFNVQIAVGKSLHNLEVGVGDEQSRLAGGGNSEERVRFPWCSYLIDVETLSFEYDSIRYSHACLADTLTIQNKQPLQTLGKVMQSTIKNRTLAIFLDVDLNGLSIVSSNLYQSFLLANLKLLACVREVKRQWGLCCSEDFIHRTLLSTIQVCYTSARAKMHRSCHGQVAWPITRQAFFYLGLHASARIFALRAFSRRWLPSLHREIVRFQSAGSVYDVHIQQAWQSCRDVIAKITV